MYHIAVGLSSKKRRKGTISSPKNFLLRFAQSRLLFQLREGALIRTAHKGVGSSRALFVSKIVTKKTSKNLKKRPNFFKCVQNSTQLSYQTYPTFGNSYKERCNRARLTYAVGFTENYWTIPGSGCAMSIKNLGILRGRKKVYCSNFWYKKSLWLSEARLAPF